MRAIHGCILAGTALTLLSGRAQAQDLFGSTNSTSHSYNYVEAQYLIGVDASPPVLATVLLDVWNNWSITGEFTRQEFGNMAEEIAGLDPRLFNATPELTTFAVGGLYHRQFAMMQQSDWIAGFLIGRGEGSVDVPEIPGASADIGFNFQEIYAGIRKTLGPSLEGELTLNYLRLSEFGTDEITADAKLVYRALPSFDVALSGNTLGGKGVSDDGNIFGIGLRYTW